MKKTRIIATPIIKGGTGKTTTAAALAQAAAHDKKKVLAIDLDPQANLSFCLGADINAPGSYELLHGATPEEVIQMTPQKIACIIGSPNLATETTKPASGKRLKNFLDPIKGDYDFIIIDTPPAMGELTFNALIASDIVIIPLEADNHSLQGFYQVIDIATHLNSKAETPQKYGAIITRYDQRAKLSRFYKEAVENAGKEMAAPLLGTIRKGIAVAEAQAMQLSLYDYSPRSNPAEDYLQLYNKIKKL